MNMLQYQVQKAVGMLRVAINTCSIGHAWRERAAFAKRLAAEAARPDISGRAAAAYLYSAAADAYSAARLAGELAGAYESALPTRASELRRARCALLEATSYLQEVAGKARAYGRNAA